MTERDALYGFTEALIAASGVGTALNGAESFRNLRGSVDEADKVVRIEVFTGRYVHGGGAERENDGVTFTVQFWKRPANASQELTDIDDAADSSFAMARQWLAALHGDQTLNGTVCLADADEWETGTANLGTLTRGVTCVDGEINPIGLG